MLKISRLACQGYRKHAQVTLSTAVSLKSGKRPAGSADPLNLSGSRGDAPLLLIAHQDMEALLYGADAVGR
jgi:hypothetical protein